MARLNRPVGCFLCEKDIARIKANKDDESSRLKSETHPWLSGLEGLTPGQTLPKDSSVINSESELETQSLLSSHNKREHMN